MTLLEIQNVSKSFGGVQANDDISFTVGNEIVGLIGPNGAGKTTLFNCISGYHQVSSGRIIFDGEDITSYSANEVAKSGIGRTFQVTRGMYGLSVEENVMIGAFMRTRHSDEARQIARAVIDEVGLDTAYERSSNELTVAEQKRLAVARTVATDPKLLMLDEILAGLNPTEVNRMIEQIEALAESRNLAILMTEHVMEAIMHLSDRLVVIDDGQKIAEGDPSEVIDDQQVKKAYLGGEFDAER